MQNLVKDVCFVYLVVESPRNKKIRDHQTNGSQISRDCNILNQLAANQQELNRIDHQINRNQISRDH